MTQRDSIARSLSEVGLAARRLAHGRRRRQRRRCRGGPQGAAGPGANAGWNRWTPVNLAVMDSLMGEQQRPSQAATGFVQRLLPESLAA